MLCETEIKENSVSCIRLHTNASFRGKQASTDLQIKPTLPAFYAYHGLHNETSLTKFVANEIEKKKMSDIFIFREVFS